MAALTSITGLVEVTGRSTESPNRKRGGSSDPGTEFSLAGNTRLQCAFRVPPSSPQPDASPVP